MLNAIRAGWFLLAWMCAGLAVLAATGSMMQITSCELGYPDAGIMPGEECEESVARTYGPPIVAVLAIPALLCLLPAVFPERLLAGLVAGTLVVGAFGTFYASAPLSVFVYFVPAAVLAVALALWHSWLPERLDALS